MADKRAFATFDVGYLDNPKIMEVFDASPIAVCMHFASVLYCAQHLTDGFIALRAMQRKVGGSDVDSKLLIEADLWHLPGHDCPTCPEVPAGKAYVHDYLEHNRSSERVKDKSATGRRAAKARWAKEKDDALSNASSNAKRMHDASETHSETQYGNDDSAMPRQTDRKKEKTSLATQDEFDQWYSRYPRKEAKEAARKAFIKARKKASLDELLDGLSRYVVANKDQARNFIALPASWLNAGRWEDELTGVAAGEIDVDAILGRDLWTPPAPPDDLPDHEYKAWLIRVRREHDEARYAEAQKRATV